MRNANLKFYGAAGLTLITTRPDHGKSDSTVTLVEMPLELRYRLKGYRYVQPKRIGAQAYRVSAHRADKTRDVRRQQAHSNHGTVGGLPLLSSGFV